METAAPQPPARSVSFILISGPQGGGVVDDVEPQDTRRPSTSSWGSRAALPVTPGTLQRGTRAGQKLMERPGVETKRVKAAGPLWSVPRPGGGGGGGGAETPSSGEMGQTEYISRLTALRDSLRDQEQIYLAQALDRLRIHSISNKTSSYRLRMNGDDVNKTLSLGNGQIQTPRATMLTTVEKFRQMRPKRRAPVIFPLQGRQLLDSPAQKDRGDNTAPSEGSNSRASNAGTGNVSSRVAKDADTTARSLPSKVDETVQANLQRLLQPTSSIPNIGRKALKQQQSIEPKTKPLFNGNSSSGSGSGNRFITRPKPYVHKRPPSMVSPDTIIDAVTYSNSLQGVNYHNGSNHYYKVNAHGQDDTCSESDSGSAAGYRHGDTRKRNGYDDSDDNNTLVSTTTAAFSYNQNTLLPYNGAYRGPQNPHAHSISHPERPWNYTQNTEDLIETVKDANNNCSSTARGEHQPRDSTHQAVVEIGSRGNEISNGRGSVTGPKKMYRNNKASHQESTSTPKQQQWQRVPPQNNGSRTKHHTTTSNNNYSNVHTSRSDSQAGLSGEVRNSIDIFLPSHPFTSPFVRSDSTLSRDEETGERWTARPESSQPGAGTHAERTRLPAIECRYHSEEDLTQVKPGTSEGRRPGRSRSNSRGELQASRASSRQHNPSSLPNVRARYAMTARGRSDSIEEGFPEGGNPSGRGQGRVSLSQGGGRAGGGGAGPGASGSGGFGGSDTGRGRVRIVADDEADGLCEDSFNTDGGGGFDGNGHSAGGGAGDGSGYNAGGGGGGFSGGGTIVSGGGGGQKRHIRVDMPSIIFNAASPDVTAESSPVMVSREASLSQGQGSTPHSRTGQSSSSATPTQTSPGVSNLSKAVKQQEIRKRELQNLMEDVRELNIRTEVLSSQSVSQE